MSVLDKIYSELYLDRTPDTAEYRVAREQVFDMWEKLEARTGPAFSSQVWDAMSAMNLEESSYDFKEGFRLGVQMILEVYAAPRPRGAAERLIPPAPPPAPPADAPRQCYSCTGG